MSAQSITTVENVKKYLPEEYPTDITDDFIEDTVMEAAHADFISRSLGKEIDSGDIRDVLVETLLSAVLVRVGLPGLSDDDDSRTTKLQELAIDMIGAKVKGLDDIGVNILPIGPRGRSDEGLKRYAIFIAPSSRYDRTVYPDLVVKRAAEDSSVDPPGIWTR
jgi:hypothetical protein